MSDSEIKKKLAKAEARADIADEITGQVASLAWRDKLRYKDKLALLKTLIICMTIVLCLGIFYAANTIRYYIDENYRYLQSLIIETETVKYEYNADADSMGDGNAMANVITGSDNTIAGGDISG